eukprot:GEMP01005731.1.p1 GENE.GEMP01005731.1~~GEMP01005731.1.p1  ORF type:complete len:706 (+),score=148.28 GEMP01005731.1:183-2300(+)
MTETLLPRRISFVPARNTADDVQEEMLMLPPSHAYLYPKSDAIRLLKSKKPPRRVGAGLRNNGNTCYLNSVLQALTYTPPFAFYLLSNEHQERCELAKAGNVCMTCIVERHVQEAYASRAPITPIQLMKRLKMISKELRVGRQEDAHEFLRHLLDACHRAFIPARGKGDNSIPAAVTHTTLVHQLFGGYLRSQVKCTACNFCSNTYDPFLDLSLELENCSSVTMALKQFTAEETLSGTNKYKCQKCKKLVVARKQFLVHKAPKVLTLQLKRFNFAMNGSKINKPVSFSMELELAPFTSAKATQTFRLFAVIVHQGKTMKSGHYYTYARNLGSNSWFKFDDESVTQVSQEMVQRSQAYVLFYELKESCLATPTLTPNTLSRNPGENIHPLKLEPHAPLPSGKKGPPAVSPKLMACTSATISVPPKKSPVSSPASSAPSAAAQSSSPAAVASTSPPCAARTPSQHTSMPLAAAQPKISTQSSVVSQAKASSPSKPPSLTAKAPKAGNLFPQYDSSASEDSSGANESSNRSSADRMHRLVPRHPLSRGGLDKIRRMKDANRKRLLESSDEGTSCGSDSRPQSRMGAEVDNTNKRASTELSNTEDEPARKRRKDGETEKVLRKESATERRNMARSFKSQFGVAAVERWDASDKTPIDAAQRMIQRGVVVRDKHDQEYDAGKIKHKPKKLHTSGVGAHSFNNAAYHNSLW